MFDDIANGPLPQHYELQPIALKATTNKDVLPDKVAQIEAVDLNKDEMALVIKRLKTALKGCKDYPNKSKSRESVHASSVVSLVILMLNVQIMKITKTKTRKGRRRRSSIERRRARRLRLQQVLPLPPTSITLPSRRKIRRYVLMIPPSILLLVLRILMMM
jgi:hypothetical protein